MNSNEFKPDSNEQKLNLFYQLNNYIDHLTKNDFKKNYDCSDKRTANLIKNILNGCNRQIIKNDPSLKKYKFKAKESQLFMKLKDDGNHNDANLIDPKFLGV